VAIVQQILRGLFPGHQSAPGSTVGCCIEPAKPALPPTKQTRVHGCGPCLLAGSQLAYILSSGEGNDRVLFDPAVKTYLTELQQERDMEDAMEAEAAADAAAIAAAAASSASGTAAEGTSTSSSSSGSSEAATAGDTGVQAVAEASTSGSEEGFDAADTWDDTALMKRIKALREAERGQVGGGGSQAGQHSARLVGDDHKRLLARAAAHCCYSVEVLTLLHALPKAHQMPMTPTRIAQQHPSPRLSCCLSVRPAGRCRHRLPRSRPQAALRRAPAPRQCSPAVTLDISAPRQLHQQAEAVPQQPYESCGG